MPPLLFADAPVQEIGFPVVVILSWIPYHLRARTLAMGYSGVRPVKPWNDLTELEQESHPLVAMIAFGIVRILDEAAR